MAARVELREISNEEGNRLLRIVRREQRLGRDLAAGADRVVGGAADAARRGSPRSCSPTRTRFAR